MNVTKEMQDVIDKCTRKWINNIDQAVSESCKRLRRLPEYNEWVESLVNNAIRGLVHEFRHGISTRIKKQNREYGQKPRTNSGSSSAVRRAAESYYDYCIAGKSLGNMLGRELGPAARACLARSNGERFNAHLLFSLEKVVKEDKSVRDCLSNRKLGNLFKSARVAIEKSADSA